jgi:hypothetical protein
MSSAGGRLSVVVVPLIGGNALQSLLETLLDPANVPEDAEILVVHGSSGAVPDLRVRELAPPSKASVPQRRALGAARASGAVIALLEDTVVPLAGWGHAALALHLSHPESGSIGGTLRLGPHLSPRSVALLLLEFGDFLASDEVSETATTLPGSNLSFKRDVLERAGVLASGSLREAEVFARLAAERRPVRLESAMAATCIAADPRGLSAFSRFQHGRLYAGRRLGRERRLERYGRALTAVALPVVLAVRALRALRRAAASSPVRVMWHVSWMSVAWSLGELTGYLRGPGDSESHWT